MYPILNIATCKKKLDKEEFKILAWTYILDYYNASFPKEKDRSFSFNFASLGF